jgi:hypothetical protein
MRAFLDTGRLCMLIRPAQSDVTPHLRIAEQRHDREPLTGRTELADPDALIRALSLAVSRYRISLFRAGSRSGPAHRLGYAM